MPIRSLLLLVFLLLLGLTDLSAQVPDQPVGRDTLESPRRGERKVAKQATRPSDTLIVARSLTDSLSHRPTKALKWSIIPGGGQVYNGRWWKVPIVYGALLGAIGVADFNQTNFKRFEKALQAECFGVGPTDGVPCTPTDHEFTSLGLSTASLVNIRDRFDKGRQAAYIGVVIVYLFQGIEAFTDAHLKTFDMEDDIGTVRIEPVLDPFGGQAAVGLVVPLGSGRKRRLEQHKAARLERSISEAAR
ncbi:MAG: DUF5683 domain-containing protein [Saprospiraceae bacterium]